jgi:alpha-tubulin suppressor-like RCC1 family protein
MSGACTEGTCWLRDARLASGYEHTCAVLSTGAVRCWGRGDYGRLGYGNKSTIGDTETPASAGDVNVGGTVLQIAAGESHTCALLSTGTVRCWGRGDYGQLGYSNSSNIGANETPASAGDVNVGGTVLQIAAGRFHTCALLSTGAVRCWGDGRYGQLGYGNTSDIGDSETPASAGDVNIGGTVIQIAAGSFHTCTLLSTGAVRCWGYASYGQLGYGSTSTIGDSETPASAGDVNVGGTVLQIAAGGLHTCALLSTGAVRCWGAGSYGRLGYGNTSTIGDSETPASAGDVNVGGAVTQIAAGTYHTCALLSTGAVRCWGRGDYGQLGYGNTSTIGDDEDETPASAGDVNVGGTVIQIAAGNYHTCALLSTGAVRCWGDGRYGRLGYGNTSNVGDDEHPASAGNVSVGGSVLPGATSLEVTRNLLDTSEAQCWSDGVPGMLDQGHADLHHRP